MIRGVLFDLDGTLVNERGNLISGLPRLLIDLEELGIAIAVLTNRSHSRAERILQEIGISGTPLFSRESTGQQKMSGGLHRAATSHLGLNLTDVVAVGDTRQDSIAAINAKVFPLGATWGGGDPPFALKVPSPHALLVLLKTCFLHDPRWYWRVEGHDPAGRIVDMRALLQAGDAWQPSMYSLLKRVLKSDADVEVRGVNFRSFLYRYTLATAYMDGMLATADIWTEYPPSSSATARRGLARLSGPAALLFRDQHAPELIQRHSDSKKSATLRSRHHRGVGTELPKFTNQTNTIKLNPEDAAAVAGKEILLLDDFITEGYSTEAGRNYLLEGGGARVKVVVVGRFGSSMIELRSPREGLPFNPYEENSFAEKDFDRGYVAGTYDRQALDQFSERWALYNEMVADVELESSAD